MQTAEKRGPGAPGIGPEKEAQIIEMARSGAPVAEIVDAVGVRKTKVYEVLRVAKRLAPPADQTGPDSPTPSEDSSASATGTHCDTQGDAA